MRNLSAKTHSVMTAFCLRESGSERIWTEVVKTQVSFRTLSEDEIQDYVRTGEPMDKAGGYAIQGEGRKFVSSFQGSWSNVVGLPMDELARAIKENGWNVRRHAGAKPQ